MKVPGPVNRFVLTLLRGRRLRTERVFVGLAVRGRRSGRVFRFPVQYAECGNDLVVSPGHASSKTWWRNLHGGPTDIEILLDGRWRPARGEVLQPGDGDYAQACASYRARWPKAAPDGEPVVRIELDRSRVSPEGVQP